MKKRLVVGVSGASGAPLAIELLRQLKHRPEVESHLILTKGGAMTLHQETGMSTEEFQELADVVHDNANIEGTTQAGVGSAGKPTVHPASGKPV